MASNTLAWSAKLLSYQLPQGRQQKRVMRVLRRGRGSERAGENLKYSEKNHRLGKTFSDSESNAESFMAAEVAVVVGEMLPLAAVSDVKAPTPGTATSPADLDPSSRTTVATQPESFVVVRKVFDKTGNLYRLADKNHEGLCRVPMLPPANKVNMLDDRLFYYPEWVEGEGSTCHGDRQQAWQNSVKDFCVQWAKEHPPRDIARSPAVQTPYVLGERESFMGRILTLAAAYKSTRQMVFIEQIRDIALKQLGRTRSATESKYHGLLDVLFEQTGDDITWDEATEMAATFQVCYLLLFPFAPSLNAGYGTQND